MQWCAGGQDVIFGCASEETELRHASHTLDGNSFEEEIDRRAGRTLNHGRKNGDLWRLPPEHAGVCSHQG